MTTRRLQARWVVVSRYRNELFIPSAFDIYKNLDTGIKYYAKHYIDEKKGFNEKRSALLGIIGYNAHPRWKKMWVRSRYNVNVLPIETRAYIKKFLSRQPKFAQIVSQLPYV